MTTHKPVPCVICDEMKNDVSSSGYYNNIIRTVVLLTEISPGVPSLHAAGPHAGTIRSLFGALHDSSVLVVFRVSNLNV